MNHKAWAAKLIRLLQARSAGDRINNTDWQELITETENARKNSVHDWHVQQTKGNYSEFLRAEKQNAAAARLEEEMGFDAEANIASWREAAIGHFALAALDYIDLGNLEQANQLGQRALRLHDQGQPTELHKDSISKLRDYFGTLPN